MNPIRLSGEPTGWFLVATAGFSMAAVVANPGLSVVSSLVGVSVSIVGLLRLRFIGGNVVTVSGVLALLVVVLSTTQRMSRFSIWTGSFGVYFLLATTTAIAAIWSVRAPVRRLAVVLALGTAVVGVAVILVPDWNPQLSTDVYRAHSSAAQAMLNGENPYSDAVRFKSGDPNKPENTFVEGYPYPVPVLVAYGGAATFTDPRLVSALAWLAVLAGLAWKAVGSSRSDVAFGVLVLLATVPIWRFTVFFGWTEPLSILLLAVSLWLISTKRSAGWIVLGVALASKQYLVFLAPLVLLYKDDQNKRPGWASLLVASVVAAFPLLLGPRSYYQSVVGNAIDIGFRPDSQSLNGAFESLGIDFRIPTVLGLLIVLITVLVVARAKMPNRALVGSGALVLATGFLVTSGFPNYWLLAASVAGLAALVAEGSTSVESV